ncbi:MAG: 30S ribosomal protein S18 [Candidatus Omnitrophica bacterium]|jgi:small subunit ribosomal protein S18|nr:30S ribosomal protein S18 [Candidatus Omnitrophota bacterium]
MKVKTKTFGKSKFPPRKKRESLLGARKKFCRFCVDKVKTLDYKDTKRLEYFINERGKMTSSRLSGNCSKHQRVLSEAIKKARYVSLLPYTR